MRTHEGGGFRKRFMSKNEEQDLGRYITKQLQNSKKYFLNSKRVYWKNILERANTNIQVGNKLKFIRELLN